MENKNREGIRACIYNRCSTEEEAQVNALEIQAAESRELVEKKGWIITAQYVESQSGTTSGKRKEYQRLLQDLETDLFDIVVIKSIDRLTRSARDWYLFLDKLMLHGKRLYLYIDRKFYTPEDNLLTGIKAILAEDFSRELSKKIKNAHKRRQEKKSGLNITVPIFGWDKTGRDTYVINEKEAEAYRLGFALALEGKGFYSIANQMYDKGVRSKKGGRISEVQWRKLLYSPRAHGTVILHTREYDFETKKNVALPEEEWIYLENALPPIVSREYQMLVLEKLRERTVKNSFSDYKRNMSKVGKYALSGKLFCESCGSPYYRRRILTGKGEKIIWQCSTAIREGRKYEGKAAGCNNRNVTEESVFTELMQKYEAFDRCACEKEVERKLEKALRKVISQAGEEKEEIRAELEKLKNKKTILMQKLLEEVISDEEFSNFNKEFTKKIQELEKKKEIINAKAHEYNSDSERLSSVRQAVSKEIMAQAFLEELVQGLRKIEVCQDGGYRIRQ